MSTGMRMNGTFYSRKYKRSGEPRGKRSDTVSLVVTLPPDVEAILPRSTPGNYGDRSTFLLRALVACYGSPASRVRPRLWNGRGSRGLPRRIAVSFRLPADWHTWVTAYMARDASACVEDALRLAGALGMVTIW